jgi:protocatechuate 3,4-dioxygenase beta subunit
MKMLARVTFVLSVSHLLVLSVVAQSRPVDAVAGNSTVSGRVTAQGKPLAGLAIGMQSFGPTGSRPIGRTKTDAEGRYQFTGVAPGTYQINPLNPLYVLPGENPMRLPGMSITIGESENVANADLALIRGGVVTGKITDSEGRPLIEQFVQLDRLDAQGNPLPLYFLNFGSMTTDDRGVYRIFGIMPGKYRASAGEGPGSIRQNTGGRKSYSRTFHPDVTEASRATVIDVGEGKEVTGVDIRLSAAVKTYAIVGRAVDAETNQPVTNVTIFAGTMSPDGRPPGMFGGGVTGTDGEFRIDGVRPDRYRVSVGGGSAMQSANNGYSDPVSVEVVDRDVTGVELRVKRGGAISGVAVVEGVTDPEILSRLLKQTIVFYVMQQASGSPIRPQFAQIAGDGSFRAEGLQPGRVGFTQAPGNEGTLGLTLLRVEREGVPRDSIEIGPGEQVSGIRVVFGYGNGIVRGEVIVKGGGLPEGAILSISARRGDEARPKGVLADARRAFAIEGLPPGEYELQGHLMIQGAVLGEFRRRATDKQTVTVANGQTTQVTLTLDLSQPEQKQ